MCRTLDKHTFNDPQKTRISFHDHREENSTDADMEDTNSMKAPEIPECVDLQKINETVNDINSKISSLKSPPQPY
jgi:hypothetical protein